MNQVITELSKVAAVKVVAALVALGVAAGVVIPLGDSQTLTATMSLAVAAVLQVAGQAALAVAAKKWPWINDIEPVVLRARLKKPVQPQPVAPQPAQPPEPPVAPSVALPADPPAHP